MNKVNTTTLGERMKAYENITRNYLIPKQPVIGRIDGKSFHSYCKQKWVNKGFDDVIIKTFHDTTLKICENVQNIEFAYHQSDEVTIFLKDYNTPQQQQHFSGNIQKLASTIASEFTYWFNLFVIENLKERNKNTQVENDFYSKIKPAIFDCRIFNVPIHEVSNNFIWRQRDCIKNSITSYSLLFFSHNQIHGVDSDKKLKMLEDINKSWYDLPLHLQRGTAFYKVPFEQQLTQPSKKLLEAFKKNNEPIPETIIRTKWVIDLNIPIFSNQRNLIDEISNIKIIEK